MIVKRMTVSDLEVIYDTIAESIDDVPVERRSLFLAKLSLVLANLVGDVDQVRSAITAALRDIG